MAEKLRVIDVPRGGTVPFAIWAREEDADLLGMTCAAALKELGPGRDDVNGDTPVAVVLDPVNLPAADGRGPGWSIPLTDDLSAQLEAGKRYLAQAAIVVNGGTYHCRRWICAVYEPGV